MQMATFRMKPAYRSAGIDDVAQLRKDGQVYFVNVLTKSTVSNAPSGNGTIGADSQWTVIKPKSIVDREEKYMGHLCPVMSFQNVDSGKFLAIKDGALALGEAAGHDTEFLVLHMARNNVYRLIHHNDHGRSIGFNGDGSTKNAENVKEGESGHFYIFNVGDVQARWGEEGVLPVAAPSADEVAGKSAVAVAAAAAAAK